MTPLLSPLFQAFLAFSFPLRSGGLAPDSVKDRDQLSSPLLDFPLLLAGLPEPASIQVMSAALTLKLSLKSYIFRYSITFSHSKGLQFKHLFSFVFNIPC